MASSMSQSRILWANSNHTDVSCPGDRICVTASPPISFNFSDGEITIEHRSPSTVVPHILIAAAASISAALLLFLAAFLLYRRRRRRQTHPAAPPAPPEDDQIFEEGDGDHHVWHIRTVGLDESAIRSIASFFYKPEDGLLAAGSQDCAVCLTDFRDGELLRLLPKCGHAFHLPCVDTWLRSHVNCPLCRAPVVITAEINTPPPPAMDVPSLNSDDTQIDSGQSEVANEIKDGVVVVEIGSGMELTASGSSSSGTMGDELQPIRRSVSMDSASLAVLLFRDEKSGIESRGTEEDRAVKIKGKRGKTGRSLSSSSGRFFFSRYSCGTPVLPF